MAYPIKAKNGKYEKYFHTATGRTKETFEIKDGKKISSDVEYLEKKEESKPEKHFYYKWGKHHTSKYGGQDGTLEVYEVEDGEIKKVGETFVQTRAMKGFESEAMDVLYKEGKITKEEYDLDRGYYYRDKHNFKISELN